MWRYRLGFQTFELNMAFSGQQWVDLLPYQTEELNTGPSEEASRMVEDLLGLYCVCGFLQYLIPFQCSVLLLCVPSLCGTWPKMQVAGLGRKPQPAGLPPWGVRVSCLLHTCGLGKTRRLWAAWTSLPCPPLLWIVYAVPPCSPAEKEPTLSTAHPPQQLALHWVCPLGWSSLTWLLQEAASFSGSFQK